MAFELLPDTLDRKQYLLRWLAWFLFVGLGFWLFVGALIRSEVYLGWIALASAYQIFGLAVPRLRNTNQSPWLAVLLLIPVINLAMMVFLFLAPRFQADPGDGCESQDVSSDPIQAASWRGFEAYWAGYVYAAFWAFVTYSCATHVLVLLITVQSLPTAVEERARFFTTLFLWPILTVVFGWVTYRLLCGKAGLRMIYVLVCVHGVNVLAKGIIVWQAVFWLVLSGIVISEFRKLSKSSPIEPKLTALPFAAASSPAKNRNVLRRVGVGIAGCTFLGIGFLVFYSWTLRTEKWPGTEVLKSPQFDEIVLPGAAVSPPLPVQPRSTGQTQLEAPTSKYDALLEPKAQSAAQVARAVFPSVVLLATQDAKGQPLTLGSGFFVEDGVIATNFHVIDGAATGYAKIIGQPAKIPLDGVVALDAAHDLALVQVRAAHAPPLFIADASPISIGDSIYAVGNPRGLEGTFSQGIISSVRDIGGTRILQITAPISPGSSGGPVVNQAGLVVGVSVATLTGGQNLNFAIPATYVAALQKRKTELRAFTHIPRTKLPKSALDELGGARSVEGVGGENLTFDTFYQIGAFSFSLRNKLNHNVANVYGFIVFYDTKGEAIDVYEIKYGGTIPPGLARRVKGLVDQSVEQLNSPVDWKDLPGPPRRPKGKVEIRILDFTVQATQ